MHPSDKIKDQYDRICEWYDKHRSRELFEKPYLDLIISHLPPHGSILDVGCAMGEPIGTYFHTHGFKVTGIDHSTKMIELARKRHPTMQFLVSDMRTINISEKFNCVIAWNSLFHLNHEDQRSMFPIFKKVIAPHGLLVFTS